MSETILGNFKESKFTWQIPNFSEIKTDYGNYMLSPTFYTTYCHDINVEKIVKLQWRMQLYPNGGYTKDGGTDYISVCLENLDGFEIFTYYSIALIDTSNDSNVWQCDSSGRHFGEKKYWGWTNFVKKDSIPISCLANNTLTILCRIYSTRVTHIDSDSEEEDYAETSLNHFEMLFNTGKFSDLTVKAGNQKLLVHKSIITKLSPVFLAMFENQMKEQNENLVEIVDVEYDTLKEMFRYMYVGKVNDIDKIADDLFVVADIYCVKGLKRFCENSMCKNLDLSNAFERLEMAVQFNANKLKRNASKFIIKNLKIFHDKSEFNKLSSECKSELLSSIAKNYGNDIKRILVLEGVQKFKDKDCSEVLMNHFEMLFNTGKFSDVTICVGNQELHVHKSIVSSLSSVFLELFENQLGAESNNIVKIDDIDFGIIKELFRFIYTRKVNEIEKIASDLFVAAYKYQIEELKKLSELSLCENLDEKNALQRLEMAMQYNTHELKLHAADYIIQHLTDYHDKPLFRKLSSECKSELLNHIILHYVSFLKI